METLDPTLRPARKAYVQLYLGERNPENFWELKVNLDTNGIVEQKHLKGRHSHVDANDMQRAEKACLADQKVQAAINGLNLPPGTAILIEPWTYATDGVYDMKHKVSMVRLERPTLQRD